MLAISNIQQLMNVINVAKSFQASGAVKKKTSTTSCAFFGCRDTAYKFSSENYRHLSHVLGGGPPIVSDLYFIFPTRGLVTVDD